MKIDISKKEYQALMDCLNISDWVLHAHKGFEGQDTSKYRQLIQTLSSYAEQMNMADLIEQDKLSGEYFPTKKYEDHGAYMPIIEEFEEYSFWSNLSFKLAIRDLIDQDGEQKVEKMELADRGSKIMQLEDWYTDEFNNNGIQNVKVQIKPTKKLN